MAHSGLSTERRVRVLHSLTICLGNRLHLRDDSYVGHLRSASMRFYDETDGYIALSRLDWAGAAFVATRRACLGLFEWLLSPPAATQRLMGAALLLELSRLLYLVCARRYASALYARMKRSA